MNALSQPNRFRGCSLAVTCAVVLSALDVSAATSAQQQADWQQCRANLEEIGKAIESWKEEKGEVPNWLSDLVPEHLADGSVLTCPVYERAIERGLFGMKDPKLDVSYYYEFCPQPIPYPGHAGKAPTMREWKKEQMKEFGDILPIVRCWLHERVLNLALSGEIYASGVTWEIDDEPRRRMLKPRVLPSTPLPLSNWEVSKQGNPAAYIFGLELTERFDGSPVGFIRSKGDDPKGFGTAMQAFDARDYQGGHLRISGWLKTENVKDWTGLWGGVEGENNTDTSWDNMAARKLNGTTDWQQFDLVVEAPEKSEEIIAGVILFGPGHVWYRDLQFAAVGKDMPLTGFAAMAAEAAASNHLGSWGNYSFGDDYERVSETDGITGLASKTSEPQSVGALGHNLRAEDYRGKLVRLSAWLRVEGVEDMAGLWLRPCVSTVASLTADYAQATPLRGSQDWQLCEVTVRVPAAREVRDDKNLGAGVFLRGPGKVFIKNASITVVDEAAGAR
jgi:hypothetical protein